MGCSHGAGTTTPPPAPPSIEFSGAWGTRGDGPGEFNAPVAMVVDNDSNVFIADSTSGYIQKFSVTGEPRLSFQDDRWNLRPADVAVDSGGGIYVLDGKRGNLFNYFPDGQRFVNQWTGAPPEARASLRIAVDAYGRVFVAGKKPFGIHRFSSNLRPIGAWGAGIAAQGAVENPAALAVGADGFVYESEASGAEIRVYSAEGSLVRTLTIPPGAVGGGFSGIAANGMSVFALEAGNPVLHIWTLDGVYRLREDLSSWISGGVETQRRIAVTPSGELLILDPLSWRVLRFRLHL